MGYQISVSRAFRCAIARYNHCMGHNDHLDDAGASDLPWNAGDPNAIKFEPYNDWLREAEPELQKEAMRRWFHDRYEDPSVSTPWSEGEYVWVYGGPYDPNDVLQDRFDDVVQFDTIQELVKELHGEAGDEWAPIDRDYDEAFELETAARDDPYKFLVERVKEIGLILKETINIQMKPLVSQMLYSSIIAAVEAYLAETMSYWISANDDVLRDFVAGCHDFQQRKFSLSEIFMRMDRLQDDVEVYLQELIWHRLDKIKPLIEAGLQITVPPIDTLMSAIIIRHDIVHRGGKTKGGETLLITDEMVESLGKATLKFAEEIENELEKKFPRRKTDDVSSTRPWELT